MSEPKNLREYIKQYLKEIGDSWDDVVAITPDELRDLLPSEMQEVFDSLVLFLTENSGLTREEAKMIVAGEVLKAIKREVWK